MTDMSQVYEHYWMMSPQGCRCMRCGTLISIYNRHETCPAAQGD